MPTKPEPAGSPPDDYKVVVRMPGELASVLKGIGNEHSASLNSVLLAALTYAAAHPKAWRKDVSVRGDRRITRHPIKPE